MLAVVLAAGGCGSSGAAITQSTRAFPPGRGFVTRSVRVDGEARKFTVFVPRDYDPRKKYPTVVFLHGLFEGGTDGQKPVAVGLGPEIARDPAYWPFITVFPQAKGNFKGDANDRLVMACLDEAAREYGVDRERIILAGLSYGGLGTWQIGARHADVFAALVPVGGFADRAAVAPLKHTPVWAFHYRGDVIVPARNAREMCDGLRAAGGKVMLTEYPGLGHNPWPKVVGDAGIVPWMLRQRLSPEAVAAAKERHGGKPRETASAAD